MLTGHALDEDDEVRLRAGSRPYGSSGISSQATRLRCAGC
jgi:hypothetical protein